MNSDSWKTNRMKKTEPKSNRAAWCLNCDRDLTRPGERCGTCGFKEKTKHRKP